MGSFYQVGAKTCRKCETTHNAKGLEVWHMSFSWKIMQAKCLGSPQKWQQKKMEKQSGEDIISSKKKRNDIVWNTSEMSTWNWTFVQLYKNLLLFKSQPNTHLCHGIMVSASPYSFPKLSFPQMCVLTNADIDPSTIIQEWDPCTKKSGGGWTNSNSEPEKGLQFVFAFLHSSLHFSIHYWWEWIHAGGIFGKDLEWWEGYSWKLSLWSEPMS